MICGAAGKQHGFEDIGPVESMSEDFQFSGVAALQSAQWLAAPATQALFVALEDAGFDARAVGGCVRNTLMGQRVADIDIATTALPDDVMTCAMNAGFSCHPTGIDHGTVTVVSRGVAFEVTTLRRDVETMGRRAVVAFTTDWAEDAQRRDFTMNALYCDRHGQLFDPLDGIGDLAEQRVVFIGDARERIREDFLRILRFFRFFAIYARGAADDVGLSACVAERDGLSLLSAERIRDELLKILSARRALDAVSLMNETGILSRSLAQPDDAARFDGAAGLAALARLASIERNLGRKPDALLRLGVMFLAARADDADATVIGGATSELGQPDAPAEGCQARELARILRLSNKDRDRLVGVLTAVGVVSERFESRALRAGAYRIGKQAVSDGLLALEALRLPSPNKVQGADVGQRTDELAKALSYIAGWPVAQMPFKGSDLAGMGVSPGPQMGAILKQFENWWVDEDFPDDTALLAARLRAIADNSHS